MKCEIEGCRKKAIEIIDIASDTKNFYTSLHFCESHYDKIKKKLARIVRQERKEGKLEEKETYSTLPKHIVDKIFKF